MTNRPSTVLGLPTSRWALLWVAAAVAGVGTLQAARLAGAEAEAWVTYSGGAVRFRLPAGWQTQEWPIGREIRVVATPHPGDPQTPFRDGVWLSYHHRSPWGADLEGQTVRRLGEVTVGANLVGGVESFIEGAHRGARQAFEQGPPAAQRQGIHALFATQSGVVELHAEAPAEESGRLAAALEEVLQSLVLKPVDPTPPADVQFEVSQAQPALGSWKALQATIAFSPAGTVEAVFDGAKVFPLDSRGYYDYRKRLTRLTGRFSAVDDLIEVRWDDGSRTNYRWREGNGRLFLTDHHGRVSELARLFP